MAASPGFCFHLYKKHPFFSGQEYRSSQQESGEQQHQWGRAPPGGGGGSPHCLGPGTGPASWAPMPRARLPVGVWSLGQTHLLLTRRG